MEIERVAFPEAIKIVADKVGMPLPKLVDDSRFEARRRKRRDRSTQLLGARLVAETARIEQRRTHRPRVSKSARNHRRNTENFSPATRPTVGMRSTYLRHQGATQQQIDRSGLVAKRRHRPFCRSVPRPLDVSVFDYQGRPIAFGGAR